MIEIKIEHKKRVVNLQHPESFNELSEDQFKTYIEYVYLSPYPLLLKYDYQLILMQVFLSKKRNYFFSKKWTRIIDDVIDDGLIDSLIELQNFIYNHQNFFNFLIKKLKVGNKNFNGIADKFAYVTFAQFITADMLLMNYIKTENEPVLNKLCAALYLENKKEFSTKELNNNTDIFSKLDNVTKHAILFNFAAMRQWLTEQYPYVFDSSEKTKSNENNLQIWLTIRSFVAKEAVNLEKVDKMMLHDVLFDLNAKMKENSERK